MGIRKIKLLFMLLVIHLLMAIYLEEELNNDIPESINDLVQAIENKIEEE